MSKKNTILTSDEYNMIVRILKNENVDFSTRLKKHRVNKKAILFNLVNGKLYYKENEGSTNKKVFSMDQVEEMNIEVSNLHKTYHYGQNRMEDMCQRLYFSIPRIIIRTVVGSCISCAQVEPFKANCDLKHIQAKKPFERVQMDLVDLSRYSDANQGYKWIMTVIDCYSKYAFAIPLYTKTGEEVSKGFADIVKTFGAPEILHTDNGREFKNAHMTRLCSLYRIKQVHGAPRHPQSQGQIERFNQTLKKSLSKALYDPSNPNTLDKKWTTILSEKLYEYNIVSHSATKKSPFELMFKRSGFNGFEINEENENIDEMDQQNIEEERPAFIFDEGLVEILENVTSGEDDATIKSLFCPYEQSLESENISGSKQDLTATNNIDIDDLVTDPLHFQKYLKRMDRSNSKKKKQIIAVGDNVLVKKNFDNNPNTKKNTFDANFSDIAMVLSVSDKTCEVLHSNNTKETVFFNRIKKI